MFSRDQPSSWFSGSELRPFLKKKDYNYYQQPKMPDSITKINNHLYYQMICKLKFKTVHTIVSLNTITMVAIDLAYIFT